MMARCLYIRQSLSQLWHLIFPLHHRQQYHSSASSLRFQFLHLGSILAVSQYYRTISSSHNKRCLPKTRSSVVGANALSKHAASNGRFSATSRTCQRTLSSSPFSASACSFTCIKVIGGSNGRSEAWWLSDALVRLSVTVDESLCTMTLGALKGSCCKLVS